MESGSASSSSSPHRTADLRSRIPGLTVCTLTMREVSSHRYQRTDCSVKVSRRSERSHERGVSDNGHRATVTLHASS
ncbi:hypothetical protein F2P81_018194 [Scophthalmus maximus]|uniref:Uncharacterized protein n=1 Tax=Scophthalmus maximus TaxID=52904 RepID=A0A6A4S954_SCOMX|nr:hypothetical protein F2P81_018194 [Scophthalmus maximus]